MNLFICFLAGFLLSLAIMVYAFPRKIVKCTSCKDNSNQSTEDSPESFVNKICSGAQCRRS